MSTIYGKFTAGPTMAAKLRGARRRAGSPSESLFSDRVRAGR